MSIDPTKCDLMHFSWRYKDDSSPSINTTLYERPLTITPPKYVRWLGFFLDWKLSFKHHIDILAARGKHVITGIQRLGNTIHGLNAHHLRLLFKMCVIPVITYGCQLWFDPRKLSRTLINKLQVIQNAGLRRIAGAFKTTPIEPLHVLTFMPPIEVTICHLYASSALRLFWLPLNSEVSARLPLKFLPEKHQKNKKPTHIPFKRPRIPTFPTRLSHTAKVVFDLDPNMEHSEPFHSHCAPHVYTSSTAPFTGRLHFFSETVSSREEHVQLINDQSLTFTAASTDPTKLYIFTDGSYSPSNGTGYAIVSYYTGTRRHISIPLSKKAGSYNAKMFALGHAGYFVKHIIQAYPRITDVTIHCDNQAAIKTIFDPLPHPTQQVSILFRTNLHEAFLDNPALKLCVVWTPGHMLRVTDLKGMRLADKYAKAGAKKRDPLLPSFASRSHHLMKLRQHMLDTLGAKGVKPRGQIESFL